MSDSGEHSPSNKKRKLILLLLLLLILGGGGGGGYFFYQRFQAQAEGDKAGAEEEAAEEEATDDETEEEPEAQGKKGGGPALPDDKNVKKVLEMQPFIVNLADKGEARYLRLTISLGIGETKEEKPDPLFTTRVRNAVIAVLTTKSSEEVLTQEGRTALRHELLQAVQQAAKEPKVYAIYIIDFIVQL
jgi:flagellar FliL protein